MRETSGEFVIFQQGNAPPAYPADKTINLLNRQRPDLWTHNSPDLNPIGYKIWREMQQWVCQIKVHDVNELKQHMFDVWHRFEQSVIDDAVDERRKHIHACQISRRIQQ